MNSAEATAYNAGVRAALDLARASADALAPQLVKRQTRIGFAVAALEALADEGASLIQPIPETSNRAEA